jgi:hypothetical protein
MQSWGLLSKKRANSIAPREIRVTIAASIVWCLVRLGTGPLEFSLLKEPVALAAGSFCVLRVWSGLSIQAETQAEWSVQPSISHDQVVDQPPFKHFAQY